MEINSERLEDTYTIGLNRDVNVLHLSCFFAKTIITKKLDILPNSEKMV